MDGNGHGTFVSKIIRDYLDAKDINYRILPLKVFDASGKGSYWDVVCAMNFIKDINRTGRNIHIVNTSFGASIPPELMDERSVLKTIIDDLSQQVLVVGSAGNSNKDTDNGVEEHFLTSYTSENILGVGGFSGAPGSIVKHPNSNYGPTSIDLAAPFEGYSIVLRERDASLNKIVNLAGTSYAAAFVTAFAAEIDQREGSSVYLSGTR